MAEVQNAALLDIQGVTKRFPGVIALADVSMQIKPGEVLAVVGENGAGKSTLMKIMAGVQTADEGQMLLDGGPVVFESVSEAMDHGIVLIHQELNLADNLDIAANVYLGREPRMGGPFGWINRAQLYADTAAVLNRLGMQASPDTTVRDLTIGQQQMVEIVKAISMDARIIIMDEPTSSLSQHETELLFDVIRDLKAQGTAVVYISHRLAEINAVCDRVVVLRDGCNAGELSREEISHDRMVQLMVGRDVDQLYDHTTHQAKETVLEVKEIEFAQSNAPCSLKVNAHEIVGLAGLVGAGRTELAQAVFGAAPITAGEILIDGKLVKIDSPMDAIKAGIAYVPEDRKQQGLIIEMSILENVTLPALNHFQNYGLLQKKKEQLAARDCVDTYNVKTPNIHQPVQLLSGGNQQKVVLGKWLSLNPKVLILDEPTRGIDIGAKQEIYQLMESLAEQGVAILMISSEMQEILALSDRIYVMGQGRITGELKRDEFSEEAVMHLATAS